MPSFLPSSFSTILPFFHSSFPHFLISSLPHYLITSFPSFLPSVLPSFRPSFPPSFLGKGDAHKLPAEGRLLPAAPGLLDSSLLDRLDAQMTSDAPPCVVTTKPELGLVEDAEEIGLGMIFDVGPE
jgi:hypothetical protein